MQDRSAPATKWAALLAACVVCAAIAPRMLAGDVEKGRARQALEAAKAALGGDKVHLRDAFIDSRRRNPEDERFDRGAARLEALRMRARQREAQIEGPLTGTTWVPIGPAPTTNAQTPQDFQQPSPVSGRSPDILLDPVNGAVFVGGAQGGVWKSVDNGATWAPLTDGLASLAVGSLAMDPSNHNVIYLGTGEGNGSCDSYAGVGVYKSTDNGATWSGPFGNAQFRNRAVGSIAVDRTNSNTLMAVSSSGIFGSGCLAAPVLPARGVFKSTDGGATWTIKTTNNKRASIVIQDPLVATRWYAAMWYTTGVDAQDGGLLMSIDNGETWSQLGGTGGLPAAASTWGRAWVTAGAAPGDLQSTLYVGNAITQAGQQAGSIYKSTDSGATWTLLSAANGYCRGQCFYDMPVYTVPNNPAVVFHGGAGAVDSAGTTKSNLRRSTDGGATFTDIMRCPAPCAANGGVPTAIHSDTHAIVTEAANPNNLWTGNDGGVWRSTDQGTTWQNRNTNLQLTQFTAFDVLQSSPLNLAYGGTQDNGTMGWTGSGVAWPHLDYGDGGYALFDQGAGGNNLAHTYFNQTNNLIAAGCTTGGFATTQGFYGFSGAGPAPNGTNNGISISDRVQFYAPMHMDRGAGAATATLYFGTHRIWRAPNFFTQNCNQDPPTSPFVSLMGATDLLGGTGFFTAIETKANPTPGLNADTVCGGSSTGRLFCTTNANAGTPTWTELDAGQTVYISDVLIDPNVAWNPGVSGVMYVSRAGFFNAVTGNQIRKTVNGGTTWTTAGTGIPDIPVNAIAIDPLVANRVWAGTDVGMYVSNDAGASWLPANSGMPNVAVFDVKTSPLPDNAGSANDGAVLAVTHGRGAFRLAPLTPVELQGFTVE